MNDQDDDTNAAGGGGLCGDVFFNASLSWDTDDPDLTSCFRKTFLVWLPCGLFWLLLPFHLRSMFRQEIYFSFL